MTKTQANWIEEFSEQEFSQKLSCDISNEIIPFIETQISIAEKRWEERMRDTILEYIPKDRENPDDYEKFFNLALKHCRQCVSIASNLPTLYPQ